MACFCEKTGVRIAAPGVSKAVDPQGGQDEVIEVDGVEKRLVTPATKPETKDAGKPAVTADIKADKKGS